MSKTHLYFIPGMATNSKIYEYIHLDKNIYKTHFLEWKIPLSADESINHYAKRMCEDVIHENPVLVGVSFGGIVAQEMSKHINTKKVIIISSIRSNKEFPKRLKLAQITNIYKLFSAKSIENMKTYINYFLDDYKYKKAGAYKKYITVTNSDYLYWAVHTFLCWKQEEPLENTIHIHGTNDRVFPIKHIKNCIEIEGGTHTMILTKAKKISSILENYGST